MQFYSQFSFFMVIRSTWRMATGLGNSMLH